MNELPVQWRRYIRPLAEVMNAIERVRWDRCIPDKNCLAIYGWVERPDRHADFAVLEAYMPERPVEPAKLYWITSSPDMDLEREVAAALGLAINDGIVCQRIEEVFGGTVPNAIRLEKR